jgi:hypothetical protein
VPFRRLAACFRFPEIVRERMPEKQHALIISRTNFPMGAGTPLPFLPLSRAGALSQPAGS